MKKKLNRDVVARSGGEFHKLNESLREQSRRMSKAHQLAEELHEQIKEVEAHVAEGKKKTRKGP